MSVFDRETGVDIQMPWEHHLVHDGKLFSVSAYQTATSAQNVNMLVYMTAASSEIHTVFAVATGGQCLITLYEGVTTSADGTTQTARSMDRDKPGTPKSHFSLGCTWSTNTEIILHRTLIPGGDSQQTRVGGAGRNDVEWIFAPGNKYLFNIQNLSGNTITTSINLTFYEMD